MNRTLSSIAAATVVGLSVLTGCGDQDGDGAAAGTSAAMHDDKHSTGERHGHYRSGAEVIDVDEPTVGYELPQLVDYTSTIVRGTVVDSRGPVAVWKDESLLATVYTIEVSDVIKGDDRSDRRFELVLSSHIRNDNNDLVPVDLLGRPLPAVGGDGIYFLREPVSDGLPYYGLTSAGAGYFPIDEQGDLIDTESPIPAGQTILAEGTASKAVDTILRAVRQ